MTRPSSQLPATAVVGLQWGDEGKGKVVDLLAAEHDATVRFNGGANAGHSVVVDGTRYALHLVPSGILYPGKRAVIGNGVVVDPATLLGELEKLEAAGIDTSGLVISDRAHVVTPYHKLEDELRELRLTAGDAASSLAGGIGTTKRGIGPAYADKAQRATAVRMGDLLRPKTLRNALERGYRIRQPMFESAGVDLPEPAAVTEELLASGERLRDRIHDTVYLLHDMLSGGRRLLFEGGNATLLDVDHGTYPFVTSSSTTSLGIGPGTGVSPARIGRVLGVCKAYCTRVGQGPMPTELSGPIAEHIREIGREYGTTTGRPRRVGWLDLVALRYAVMINGATHLALTMLDVLSGLDEINICTAYEIDGDRTDRFIPDGRKLDHARPVYESLPGFAEPIQDVRRREHLPGAARALVDRIERAAGAPAAIISVGPGREQTIRCEAI